MTSPLELAANVLTALAIVLAGRNNVHTWWTGIVGCSLFGLVFYESRLYADVVLQAFFVGTSLLGWWQWLRGNAGQPLAVTHARFRSLLWTLPVGVAATAAYGLLLKHWTNAYAPFLDSAVLVFSIIAQILMMRRRIENWAFWLVVNSIAVPLYATRGLYLTAALYAFYWVNAVVSWRWWLRLAEQAQADAAASPGIGVRPSMVE
ncbi:nicotinamide riboside transporter PnuC [Massilia arenosa]|uniref:Nicotinamide riboside transporter PnuC n=1 Tax=Zemynaea arenosa TaxID=2561931 RepID=A0A4Y9SIJ4_9BURK|nr:nicotinamide riboside transporter PnuC [Massilia arenosa]TFW21918.1 nicotinamide riboside transporter PnuC [Massilia arenosa]